MIGILALQGGVAAHSRMLEFIGLEVCRVRHAADLEGLKGLVLPGGESTTMNKLMDQSDLLPALHRHMAEGIPTLATCAGLIIASQQGWLEAKVQRNAYGPQLYSCQATADDGKTRLHFIRAPQIVSHAKHVEVLLSYQGSPVLMRQGNLIAASFHPELTDSPAIHQMVFAERSEELSA